MDIKQLSDAYLTDRDSPFPKLRYVTRQGYERNIARLIETMGTSDLSAIGSRDLLHIHAGWVEGGKLATAHGLMTQLRIVIAFGATILENPECQRLRGILSGLRFKNAPPRTTWITADQADDIRDEASRQLFVAIATAQAFQFDCAMRQKDVIGEWVPIEDPEPSTILSPDGQMKWVRGITREEINADLVLTHKTSKRGQVLSYPLTSCPMVMEEFDFIPPSGPLIIDPQTDLPYEAWKYRRVWRQIATKAGVPANVWNMDSRAGRITMVIAAGANLEDARKLAGHENQKTTSRYSRGTADAVNRALEKALQSGQTYQQYAKDKWDLEE